MTCRKKKKIQNDVMCTKISLETESFKKRKFQINLNIFLGKNLENHLKFFKFLKSFKETFRKIK